MPRKLFLGIVLHNHQPVGNYGWVIAQIYNDAYLPMLEALERHAAIRVALHNSGPLFEWIRANRPDYLPRLRALCDRGQVEIMTGGYYEPILPMIIDGDKVGQIRKMTGFIEDNFAQTRRRLGSASASGSRVFRRRSRRLESSGRSSMTRTSG